MRISIELVPRTWESLNEEMQLTRNLAASVGTVNIPDLARFSIRSWEASAVAGKVFPGGAIPHIRAIDFDLSGPLDGLIENLKGVREILVIHGDPSPEKQSFPTESADLIARIKREAPQIKCYAAIDPYRWEIKREMDYMKQKIDAGAEGFFSQPFFDLRLVEIYAEKLPGKTIFWGVSPVVTEKSRVYWESRNRAHFPAQFEATMDWNIDFARKAVSYCHDAGHNIYLMPIKIDLKEYLKRVFDCSEAPIIARGLTPRVRP